MRVAVVALVLVGCASDDGATNVSPLAPLPPPAPATTDRFADHGVCAQCHLVDDNSAVLHDATGANVAPVLLWRASLMAMAARDPYYLAVFAGERARSSTPAAVDKLCTRCHAPAGNEERDGKLGLADLVAGSDAASALGRDGVTCTACHQIGSTDLGTESSFTGGFSIGYGRLIFGPIADPVTGPMMLVAQYIPTAGAHVSSATLCATCHTVIVPTSNGQVVEQGTFLEWRSSQFSTQDQPCQTCHVSPRDSTGAAISTVIANFTTSTALGARPLGRHDFVGGNAYILQLLAGAVDWAKPGVSADELLAAAARDRVHLTTAAVVTIANATRSGDGIALVVHVDNLTGHKLPTGYPSRRMWLHVTATQGGQTVFESGATNAAGAIVDATGTVLPAQPHRDAITGSDQVQVWEGVLVDLAGNPTDRTLAARRYGKDDRILPRGFAPTPNDMARIGAVGVVADPSFGPGSDEVTYQLAGIPAGAQLTVELVYQATRPETIEALAEDATPAAARFVALARARPVTTEILATVTTTAPQ